MSTSTASVPRARAERSASVSTADGSAPAAPRWKAAPAREAHTSSCSAAAARNVSAAHRSTERPSAVQPAASLPIVVVLPAPLTPTTKTTQGRAEKGGRARRPLERAPDLLDERLAHGVEAARGDLAAAGAKDTHGLLHGAEAQVGGEERLLHRLERGRVEGAPAPDEVLDRGMERLPRAGEPAAQAVAEPH